MSIQVTVWNEYRHELSDEKVRAIYPDGIHGAIATGLQEHAEFVVRTATLDEPDQGLPPAVLDATDVLLWWGHKAHPEVSDELVDRIQRRVLDGIPYAGESLFLAHGCSFIKSLNRFLASLMSFSLVCCVFFWKQCRT